MLPGSIKTIAHSSSSNAKISSFISEIVHLGEDIAFSFDNRLIFSIKSLRHTKRYVKKKNLAVQLIDFSRE
jgi:hypothetical protein